MGVLKVRVLNDYVDATASGELKVKKKFPGRSRKKKERILTGEYVQQLNREIAFQIEEKEAMHAEGVAMAEKAYLR